MAGLLRLNQSPYWIKLYDPDIKELTPRVDGKWVYHAKPKQLAKIAIDLVPLVLEGLSVGIKYKPTIDSEGKYAGKNPPMCVYSTHENKDVLEKRLKAYGLKKIYWQSEQATRDRIEAEFYEKVYELLNRQ